MNPWLFIVYFIQNSIFPQIFLLAQPIFENKNGQQLTQKVKNRTQITATWNMSKLVWGLSEAVGPAFKLCYDAIQATLTQCLYLHPIICPCYSSIYYIPFIHLRRIRHQHFICCQLWTIPPRRRIFNWSCHKAANMLNEDLPVNMLNQDLPVAIKTTKQKWNYLRLIKNIQTKRSCLDKDQAKEI